MYVMIRIPTPYTALNAAYKAKDRTHGWCRIRRDAMPSLAGCAVGDDAWGTIT